MILVLEDSVFREMAVYYSAADAAVVSSRVVGRTKRSAL